MPIDAKIIGRIAPRDEVLEAEICALIEADDKEISAMDAMAAWRSERAEQRALEGEPTDPFENGGDEEEEDDEEDSEDDESWGEVVDDIDHLVSLLMEAKIVLRNYQSGQWEKETSKDFLDSLANEIDLTIAQYVDYYELDKLGEKEQ
jgi:hypothetical protein